MKKAILVAVLLSQLQGCMFTIGLGNMVGTENSEGMVGGVADFRLTIPLIKGKSSDKYVSGADFYIAHTSMILQDDKGHGIQHAGVQFTLK